MYMPKNEPKTGGLVTDIQGNMRFKTFRANNELYMRIDSIKPEVEANEQRIYDALVKSIKKGMPDSSRQHLQGGSGSDGSGSHHQYQTIK